VTDGKVDGGGRKQVDKGESLTIRVTSDVADERCTSTATTSPPTSRPVAGRITFTPNAAGVFESSSNAGLQLLELGPVMRRRACGVSSSAGR
jgi:hypothetical protein